MNEPERKRRIMDRLAREAAQMGVRSVKASVRARWPQYANDYIAACECVEDYEATLQDAEYLLAERDERIKQLAKAAQALLGNITGKTTQGRFIVQSLDVMALQIALSQLNEQEPKGEKQHGR